MLAELGIDAETPPITRLRHVRSSGEKRAAQDIANRQSCEDFNIFKPVFENIQKELEAGLRQTRPFEGEAEIKQGQFFVLAGQKAYIARIGKSFVQDYGYRDARLRVIFDNGTESNMLMRSLQRALNKDTAGRRITDPIAGPLFSDHTIDADAPSGTIYVLRSMSDHPLVAKTVRSCTRSV